METKDKLADRIKKWSKGPLERDLPGLFEKNDYEGAFHRLIEAIATALTDIDDDISMDNDLPQTLKALKFRGNPAATRDILTKVCNAALS